MYTKLKQTDAWEFVRFVVDLMHLYKRFQVIWFWKIDNFHGWADTISDDQMETDN